MPIVEVKMLAGRTPEQKKELASKLTELMAEVAGARKEAVIVNFQDFEPDHYAIGGVMMSEKNK
ncbi:MAG: 2-hydroxymuconate tautomerase [Thermincolia bacterium]